jgi:prepilin-type N-terminal cleavage/methylation domain-containing protein
MKPQRRAFTLVELLVVIGIIAVLIGILIPVVSKMRIQGQITNTKQQLSRISQAITIYEHDFRGYPGLLPTQAFQGPSGYFDTGSGTDMVTPTQYTQAEDLVMALMGGLNAVSPTTAGSKLQFKKDYVGTGATTLNWVNPGKKAAYMPRVESDISSPGIQLKADGRLSAYTYVTDSEAPEFIDQFADPRPLLYMRLNGSAKAGDVNFIVSNNYDPTCHYNLFLVSPYLNSTDPKEILALGASDSRVKQYFTAGQSGGSVGTAKFAGTYILISAGADRKFGTDDDIVYGAGGGQ